MFNSICEHLKNTRLTGTGVLLALGGIATIRAFLEVFSSPTVSGVLPVESSTLVHYFLFYVTAYFAFSLLVGFFSRNYSQAALFVLFGMIILWLPPAVDLVISGGVGSTMTYLFDPPASLLRDFLTFFGPETYTGVTIGIRVEAVFLMLGVGGYVYLVTRDRIRALAAAFLSYVIMFILIALPALLYIFGVTTSSDVDPSPLSFIVSVIRNSLIIPNAFTGSVVPATTTAMLEIGFNKLLSVVLILSTAMLGIVFIWKIRSAAFFELMKNIRPVRLLHFLILVTGGAFLGIQESGTVPTLVDIGALIVLLLAFTAAWLVAVCVNDVHDQDIDAISNSNRPLIQGHIGVHTMQEAGLCFFVFSLLAAFVAGYYPLFFLLVFTACYYIYSAPPLRLKRIPVLASALIAFACVASVSAGFLLTSVEKNVTALPTLLLFGLFICYSLAMNVRDLKDIAGDTAAGVATIPTIITKRFGTRVAFHSVGIIAALAILISPFFVHLPFLFFLAGIAAVCVYVACIAQPYKEIYVLAIHLLYLASAGVLYYLYH